MELSKRCNRITGMGAESPFDTLIPSPNGAGSGHVARRRLLEPAALPFSFGIFINDVKQGGSCLEVPEPSSGSGATYGQVIWPPAGFVPIELADAPWSISPIGSEGAMTVSIVRSPPGTTLGATAARWVDGQSGSPVALLTRTSWVPVVNRSYVVSFQEAGQPALTYGFEPIDCGP